MEQLEGYVERIIFRNSENGYSVMEIVSKEAEIIAVGTLQTVHEGEFLTAEGSYVEHPVYGQQFQIVQYEIKIPEDCLSIERYLASGAVKGIGAALAGRIVKRFKEDTFRIMEEEPERLSEVKGISERKAREIAKQVEENKELRQAMLFLQNYGITTALAMKIYNRYGQTLYQVLRENPYQMADDIQGVGFKIADEIASKTGIHTDSDYRIRSGILYTLYQAVLDGHVYLPQEVLVVKARELLGVEAAGIENQLTNMMMDKKLVIKKRGEEIFVYASKYYYLELNTARMLLDLNIKSEESEEKIQKKVKSIEKSSELKLDSMQKKAVAEAVKNGIMILTGGPGTGKTTTINAMIQYFEQEGLDFVLAAPTGRAAKRMTETTGYEAKTIHRLLEFSGQPEGREENSRLDFDRNEQNPLEADVVIIDEMSMVDIVLLHSLLKAVSVGTRLIMVGDVDQLPSVGPGSVLKDMIRSGCFQVVMLTKIFRQASQSSIVVNAHKINAGKQIDLLNKKPDFFIMRRYDAAGVIEMIKKLVVEILPPNLGIQSYDIQILTPMRKGSLGVEELNRRLQEVLNPESGQKREKEYADRTFREGDKVMQIKNNYQLEWEITNRFGLTLDKGMGVFNGDMGVIRTMNLYEETLTVEFEEGRKVIYPFKQLEELEHAYAVTIHKSQGSEYPAVILPILTGPPMLMNRNLLYTAVTRAKSCVTIVGSEQSVIQMIRNENEQKRYSSLDCWIEEIWKMEEAM